MITDAADALRAQPADEIDVEVLARAILEAEVNGLTVQERAQYVASRYRALLNERVHGNAKPVAPGTVLGGWVVVEPTSAHPNYGLRVIAKCRKCGVQAVKVVFVPTNENDYEKGVAAERARLGPYVKALEAMAAHVRALRSALQADDDVSAEAHMHSAFGGLDAIDKE